mgnify:CR=1 FL=1
MAFFKSRRLVSSISCQIIQIVGINQSNPLDAIDLNGKMLFRNSVVTSNANFGGNSTFYEYCRFYSSGFSRFLSIGADLSGNKFGFATSTPAAIMAEFFIKLLRLFVITNHLCVA